MDVDGNKCKNTLSFRAGSVADAAQVARLHSDSWRNVYRGVLTDAYLDGIMDEEKFKYWHQFLVEEATTAHGRIHMIVATRSCSIHTTGSSLSPTQDCSVTDASNEQCQIHNGNVVAFVAICLDEEPQFGGYINNLHVDPTMRSQGLGQKLLGRAAKWIRNAEPSWNMYLWVLEANIAAIRFYERHGAVQEGEGQSKEMPGSGECVLALRYVWDNVDGLIQSVVEE